MANALKCVYPDAPAACGETTGECLEGLCIYASPPQNPVLRAISKGLERANIAYLHATNTVVNLGRDWQDPACQDEVIRAEAFIAMYESVFAVKEV